MTIGIYEIKNNINNKIYIGLSRNVENRVNEHFRLLGKNEHKNYYLQNSYNKYKKESFTYKIIEECTEEELESKEIYYIKFYNSNDLKYGYNLTAGGEFGSQLNQDIRDMLAKNLPENRRNSDIKNGYIYLNALDKMIDAENYNISKTIDIKKYEIDCINNLISIKDKKRMKYIKYIAFILLCISKICNTDKLKITQSEIINLLFDKKSKSLDIRYCLEKLEEMKFIKLHKDSSKTIQKDFIDKNKNVDNLDITITITDFRNLILHYEKYLGEKIINCENCGCLIKDYNSKKYCNECAKEIKKEQWKIASKKYYHKNKNPENP